MSDSSAPSTSHRIPHLAALDGLRALGLLGVLTFHAQADGFLPGGYLGVDLFFVLSGYLITSLLLAEHQSTGRIDLWAFWVRRCRRLFPALLALMPAIAMYGRFFARPEDLQALRNEAIASLSYVANWRAIFDHRSYWQLFAQPSPLEHTWSLSIEEQFYVIWPLLVVLLLRRFSKRSVLLVSVTLTLVSMGAMMLLFTPNDTSRVYLGTDTRMASILAGAAFATLLPPTAQLPAALTRWLDLLGAATVVALGVAWCTLSGTDPFLYHGGFWLAELGVLVLIACAVLDKKSLVARALSFRPLTWLGTVSYGVYLWHWPVNVLLTAERTHLEGAPLQLVRLGLTLGVALLSFYFIEQPIRRHGLPFGRPQYMVPASVCASVFLVVFATDARGSLTTASIAAHPPVQAAPAASARYRVVLFGDSTANSLGWGLLGLHEDGVAVDLLGKDGCNMLTDSCRAETWAARVTELKADVTLLHLGGAFLHGFNAKGKWRTACYADWDSQFEQAVTRRVGEMAATGRQIFVVTAPYPLKHWEDKGHRAQLDCVNKSLRKAAASAPGVRILDLSEHICPKGECTRNLPDGDPIRPDGVHFSLPGAVHIGRWAWEELQAERAALGPVSLQSSR